MSAAAAPRKPKKGAVSSPLKVEPAMGSRLAGEEREDGRDQGQATTILRAGARSLSFSVDSGEKQYYFFMGSWAGILILLSARLVGCLLVPGLRLVNVGISMPMPSIICTPSVPNYKTF